MKDTDTNLNLWLPIGIDPDNITGNGERPARIAFLAHLLTVKPFDDRRRYISLNQRLLYKQISRKATESAFSYFNPAIDIDSQYKPNRYSKGYRWNQIYRDQRAIKRSFKCPNLIKRLNKLTQETQLKYDDIQQGLDSDMNQITLDIDISNTVSKLVHKAGVKSEAHRRNVIQASGEELQAGRFGVITRSEKTGRIHCSVNRLSSILRRDLQLGGEATVEIDLASSQPYFLATLFHNAALKEAVSRGEFYQRVNEQLTKPKDLSEPHIYSFFKQSILAILYARRSYIDLPSFNHSDTVNAMEKAYNGIMSFLAIYRINHGDTALPIAMQKLESQIFINEILTTLQLSDIPAIPIHDSILCRVGDADYVEGLIYDKLIHETKIEPTLKRSLSA